MPSTPDLLRAWIRVDGLAWHEGVVAQWRAKLDDDFDAVRPFLKPRQKLATEYPCPGPIDAMCPRRVIWHAPNDIVAVCGQASPLCETIGLSRADIVVYALRSKEWTEAVVAALHSVNDLRSLDLDGLLVEGVIPIGVLERRGKRIPILWMRQKLAGAEDLLRGLRARLEGDGLIAIMPPGTSTAEDRLIGDRIALLSPPRRDDGFLELHRGLDLLDPAYRERRLNDPTAIFEEVTLSFSEEPGVRHVVKLNGHDVEGFQHSDQRFIRLLLIAAARKRDGDVEGGGWLRKAELKGDARDHQIEQIRDALREHRNPTLSESERAALVKSSPKRDATIRLAVDPANIHFDESLARIAFVGEQQCASPHVPRRATPGQKRLADNLARGRKLAEELLHAARCLGVSGGGVGEKAPRRPRS